MPFRIAWLSDLRFNEVGQQHVRRLCEEARGQADTVVITGDIADRRTAIRWSRTLADRIKRPTYFRLGNHEPGKPPPLNLSA